MLCFHVEICGVRCYVHTASSARHRYTVIPAFLLTTLSSFLNLSVLPLHTGGRVSRRTIVEGFVDMSNPVLVLGTE